MPGGRHEPSACGCSESVGKESVGNESVGNESVGNESVGSPTMARDLNLALIPGDGIGTEVVAEAMKVLDAVAPKVGINVSTTHYDLGATRYNATGELLPDAVIEELRTSDAILLGAIGDPSVPPGVLERGVLLPLRFVMDHHVNLRPVKLYPGVQGPLEGGKTIDFVVCREGTEGPYVGAGGVLRRDTPQEVATEESLNTAFGVERIVRDAFDRATKRRKHVTLVHKTNVLTNAGSLWKRTFDRVASEFDDVATDYQHVDVLHHQPRSIRRCRHGQPVRRHLDRHRSCHRWRNRAGGQRKYRSVSIEPVDVRASAWFGSRHRRAGQGRSDGDRHVLGHAARPCWGERSIRVGGGCGGC